MDSAPDGLRYKPRSDVGLFSRPLAMLLLRPSLSRTPLDRKPLLHQLQAAIHLRWKLLGLSAIRPPWLPIVNRPDLERMVCGLESPWFMNGDFQHNFALTENGLEHSPLDQSVHRHSTNPKRTDLSTIRRCLALKEPQPISTVLARPWVGPFVCTRSAKCSIAHRESVQSRVDLDGRHIR